MSQKYKKIICSDSLVSEIFDAVTRIMSKNLPVRLVRLEMAFRIADELLENRLNNEQCFENDLVNKSILFKNYERVKNQLNETLKNIRRNLLENMRHSSTEKYFIDLFEHQIHIFLFIS